MIHLQFTTASNYEPSWSCETPGPNAILGHYRQEGLDVGLAPGNAMARVYPVSDGTFRVVHMAESKHLLSIRPIHDSRSSRMIAVGESVPLTIGDVLYFSQTNVRFDGFYNDGVSEGSDAAPDDVAPDDAAPDACAAGPASLVFKVKDLRTGAIAWATTTRKYIPITPATSHLSLSTAEDATTGVSITQVSEYELVVTNIGEAPVQMFRGGCFAQYLQPSQITALRQGDQLVFPWTSVTLEQVDTSSSSTLVTADSPHAKDPPMTATATATATDPADALSPGDRTKKAVVQILDALCVLDEVAQRRVVRAVSILYGLDIEEM